MPFDPSRLVRQYSDPQEEALACRANCALFDFSFVARARVAGPEALATIARVTRRPLDRLAIGRIAYAVREDRRGCLVSDLTIWRHGECYEVMSGRAEDIADLVANAPKDCRVDDLSSEHAIFAVQGPRSLDVLAQCMDAEALEKLPYFSFTSAHVHGVPCTVGRLGYTGEPGFEIVLPRGIAEPLWQQLSQQVRPGGFAAADILRIEAGFVLFANEFKMRATAAETGLERFTGGQQLSFNDGLALVCFTARSAEKPVLWRPSASLARPTAGTIAVTSACHSVLANDTLGLGFALQSDLRAGRRFCDPGGQFENVTIVPRPFFDRGKRRPRADWASAPS
jgi:glycine cleavage system T protein (aminomethyltransferase)